MDNTNFNSSPFINNIQSSSLDSPKDVAQSLQSEQGRWVIVDNQTWQIREISNIKSDSAEGLIGKISTLASNNQLAFLENDDTLHLHSSLLPQAQVPPSRLSRYRFTPLNDESIQPIVNSLRDRNLSGVEEDSTIDYDEPEEITETFTPLDMSIETTQQEEEKEVEKEASTKTEKDAPRDTRATRALKAKDRKKADAKRKAAKARIDSRRKAQNKKIKDERRSRRDYQARKAEAMEIESDVKRSEHKRFEDERPNRIDT